MDVKYRWVHFSTKCQTTDIFGFANGIPSIIFTFSTHCI